MEEEVVKPVATAPKSKKLKYEDLPLDAVVVFEVTTHDTKIEDGAVELAYKPVQKSGSKAFWEGLEEWPAGHSKAGQKKDITDGLRAPKLVGYYDAKAKETVKF